MSPSIRWFYINRYVEHMIKLYHVGSKDYSQDILFNMKRLGSEYYDSMSGEDQDMAEDILKSLRVESK